VGTLLGGLLRVARIGDEKGVFFGDETVGIGPGESREIAQIRRAKDEKSFRAAEKDFVSQAS
jgi:hypothetical protein